MLATYKARLRDDKIIWDDGGPHVSEGAELTVYVTVLGESDAQMRARVDRMVDALEQLAALPESERSIKDPVAWEREQREDQPLFGRS